MHTKSATRQPTGKIGAPERIRIQKAVVQVLSGLGEIEPDENAWWLLDLLRSRGFVLASKNPVPEELERDMLDRWWNTESHQIRKHCLWLQKHNLPFAYFEKLLPKGHKLPGFRYRSKLLRAWSSYFLLLSSIQKYSLALCLVLPQTTVLSEDDADRLQAGLVRLYEQWERETRTGQAAVPTPSPGILGEGSLARLTHDFRKPLANLILNHENLQAWVESQSNPMETNPERFRDALRRFGDQLQMLDGYTHDLLYLLTGRKPAQKESEEFVLEFLVEKICKELNGLYQKHKKITVRMDTETHTWCRLHYRYTYRILYNLLENAFKFSASPGMVYIDIQTKGPWIRLGIEDNGKGLGLEDEDFELSRLNLNRSGGSWGIGLASCHELTKRMGGRLLQRRPRHGSGAHFLLVLPNYL